MNLSPSGDLISIDINVQLEQFTIHPLRAPQRVGDTHLQNEPTNFGRNRWPFTARS